MLETAFQLKRHNAWVYGELIAGATTFIASMYIIIVTPALLSQTGMS